MKRKNVYQTICADAFSLLQSIVGSVAELLGLDKSLTRHVMIHGITQSLPLTVNGFRYSAVLAGHGTIAA